MKKLLLFALLFLASHAYGAGGACPSGANYLSLTSPQTGGGFGSVTLASLGVTSCYYISAAGADTNNGTNEATPWKHAPGMPNCSNTCAGVTPSANVGFIFRGGDIYHRSASTNDSTANTAIGGQWTISQSGTSGNLLYFGVDFTWYSGGSFARPVFTMDNPLSTSTVSSCTYDDGAPLDLISTSGTAYVEVDAFEFTGLCSTGGGGHGLYFLVSSSGPDYYTRHYAHGWTVTTSGGDDTAGFTGTQDFNSSTNHTWFNVIDGADSTYGAVCTTTSCPPTASAAATGWCLQNGYDVAFNVIRHCSNALEAGMVTAAHDNLFEFIFEPSFGGRHGNILEGYAIGSINAGTPERFYNNIVRNSKTGVGIWMSGNTIYAFNNVCENVFNASSTTYQSNGFMFSPQGNSGNQVVSAYFVNNTVDPTCATDAPAGSPSFAAGSTVTFENNQIIGWAGIFTGGGGAGGQLFSCGGGNCTNEVNSGGEIFQTLSVANGQGYTLANDFAPTLGTNATVGAGNNLTSSCATFSGDSALCIGKGGVKEVAVWGGQMASYPAVTVNPRPGSGAWDAGAFQFSASTASAPSCSPGSGTYLGTQTVTCTNPNSGTTVMCYNFTGSPATSGDGVNCPGGSTKYTTAVIVGASSNLYVVAGTSAATDSSIVTYNYKLYVPASSGGLFSELILP